MADTEIGGLIVRMKADLSDYQQKLDQMDKTTVKTSDKVTAAFKGMTTVMAGAGVAINGFAVTAVNAAMKWGNAVDDLSDKTGMAAEKASELLVYAKRVGIGAEEAGTMFARFSRTIYNSADAMEKAKSEGKDADTVLARLGVSATDLSTGAMRDTADIFMDIKDKLSGMQDGWQKTALEMELFGRSGTEMHDMLNMTKEEMQAVKDKAEAMGLILNNQQSAAWEKFQRDLNGAKGTLSSLGITIATDALPKLKQLLDFTNNNVKAFVAWKKENPGLADSLFKVAEGIAAISLAIKGVTLAAAKVPKWAIPILIRGGIAGGVAGIAYGVYEAVTLPPIVNPEDISGAEAGAGGAISRDNLIASEFDKRADEEKVNEIIGESARGSGDDSTTNNDTFLGGGGGGGGSDAGSSGDSKTALQAYMEETGKLQGIWEQESSLGQISRAQFQQLLQERLTGMKAIAAGDDEVLDKQRGELDLTSQINELGKQARQEAIETANQKLQVNEITKQQYLEVLQSQAKLVTSDKERYDMQIKILGVQKEIAEEALKQIGNQLIGNQSDLAMQEEASRSKLAIQEIVNSTDKIGLMQTEYEQKKEYLKKEYDLVADSIDQELKVLKDNNQENSDAYKDLLEKKKQLTSKYNLDMEKTNNAAIEKQVSEQQKIINANNDMITSLITKTKSGHDILEDMWSDFVQKVVAKMFSIKSSMNVFEQILGPLVGLSTTSSGSSSSGWTGVERATGGIVYGAGTDTSDSIFSKLSNGEYVIKAASVRAYGKDFFDMLNAGVIPRFATGGIVEGGGTVIPDTIGSIIPNSAITSGQILQQNQTNSTTGGNSEISVNVVNNTGTEATPTVSKSMDSGKMVINVVLDAVTRNVGGLRSIIAGVK